MKRRTAGVMLLTVLVSLLVVAGAQALTLITNTTSGGSDAYAPFILNPGWRFTAKADTVTSDVICIEVHPIGDTGNFVRTPCVLSSGSNPYDWTCNVFTGGVPQAFRSKTVQYQFHAAAPGTNCQGSTYAYTGFNWTFNTDPLAISLRALNAEPKAASTAWAATGLLIAVGGVSLLLLIRLLKFRR